MNVDPIILHPKQHDMDIEKKHITNENKI